MCIKPLKIKQNVHMVLLRLLLEKKYLENYRVPSIFFFLKEKKKKSPNEKPRLAFLHVAVMQVSLGITFDTGLLKLQHLA